MRIQRNIILGHPFVSTVNVRSHLSRKLSLILLRKPIPRLPNPCFNCRYYSHLTFIAGIHDQHTRDSEIHEHDDDCDRGSGGREHKDVWLTSRLLSGCLATACIHPLFIDGLEIFYEGNQKVAAISEISSPSELQLIQLDNVEV
ncbi:hypothetical protein VPH35_109200 [Triticum aestivum]